MKVILYCAQCETRIEVEILADKGTIRFSRAEQAQTVVAGNFRYVDFFCSEECQKLGSRNP